MSVIQFLTSGGIASVGGSLPETEQKAANEVIRNFGERVKKYAIALQVPASMLKVQQCTYLLVAKDSSHYHIVFADGPGGNSLSYIDLTSHGRLELKSIVRQVRIEVGDVAWAFSYPANVPSTELDNHIQNIVVQYVNTVLQSQNKPGKKISEEAVSSPEIASGLEKFKTEYPTGSRTAFVIMQFEGTRLHKSIVQCIKDTLKKRGITALCADDKEYMDDLFPNVKVYMHGCDFGIAVFDRITQEDFNPNVSLEVGYMLGMGKNVLLLKDKTLKSLPSDLTGKLYKEFDTTEAEATIPQQIDRWLTDKGIK